MNPPSVWRMARYAQEVFDMKKLITLGLSLLVLLSFAGCSKDEAPEASAESAVGRYADQLYVEVSALNSLEYFYDHKEGMRLVGEDLGVKTEYTGPADYDMNAVATAIEQAVAKKSRRYRGGGLGGISKWCHQ